MIIGIAALIALLSGAMGAWQRTLDAAPRRMNAFADRYGEGARWMARALVGAICLMVAALLPGYRGAILGGIVGGLILLWAVVGYLRTLPRDGEANKHPRIEAVQATPGVTYAIHE